MLDKIGQEITVGCFIAYGHNLDRSAGLRIGRVERINIAEVEDTWDHKIYDKSTITVLGLYDDYETAAIRVLEKRSTLLFPKRTLVITNLPVKYSDLYKKDCVGSGNKHKWDNPKEWDKVCTVCGNKPSSWAE